MVVFKDEENRSYGVSDVILDSDVHIQSIPRNSPVNYPCDAKDVLRAQTDGSIRLGGLASRPGYGNIKLTVSEMCVWIGVKYKMIGVSRKTQSIMFEWIPMPGGGHQWIEGPIVSSPITQAAQTCRAKPAPPFVRLHGESNPPTLELDF
jgi:hypothetical protein